MADNTDTGAGTAWILGATGIAAVAALLGITNYFLAASNTNLISDVRERQQVINQSVQLSPLNAQLAQLIANLAQRSGDIDMRAVLERHGISIAELPPEPVTPVDLNPTQRTVETVAEPAAQPAQQ